MSSFDNERQSGPRPCPNLGPFHSLLVQNMGIPNPIFIIVMGVSGCGKSTLGAALAKELGLSYKDGDDLHPPESVAKMSIGIPLDDADRAPWLRKIRSEGVKASSSGNTGEHQGDEGTRRGLVIGCSALKKAYRRVLRGEDEGTNMHGDLVHEESSVPTHKPFLTRFVYILGNKEELVERMSKREGHYMKVEMLNSQLATLEEPDPTTEQGIATVRLEDSAEVQVKNALAGLEALQ